MSTQEPIHGYGLCRCGCGGKTAIAKWNDRTKGYTAGEPKPWLKGHATRRGVPTSGWTVDEETGCWIWDGTKSNGYGIIRRGDKRYGVHRVIYQDRVGPVPDGLELDHLCRNRACVNPAHLEPVTRAENARRSPFVKLNREDAAAIRESDAPHSELAERYGVSATTVIRIRQGEIWR